MAEHFSYSDWTDKMDVGANPVENKIRRDWLSSVLRTQLHGYEPNDSVDEGEFLDHYADGLFMDCLALNARSPFATLVAGKFAVPLNAGWAIGAREFGNIFNDARSTLALKFAQWLQAQPAAGDVLKEQLLGIYCNGVDAAHGESLLRQEPIKI